MKNDTIFRGTATENSEIASTTTYQIALKNPKPLV